METHLTETIGPVTIPIRPLAPELAGAKKADLENALEQRFPFQLEDRKAPQGNYSLSVKEALVYMSSKLDQWGIQIDRPDLPMVVKELFSSLAGGDVSNVVDLPVLIRSYNLTAHQTLNLSLDFKDADPGNLAAALPFPSFLANLLHDAKLGITLSYSE